MEKVLEWGKSLSAREKNWEKDGERSFQES
jgi:hypothetical protein